MLALRAFHQGCYKFPLQIGTLQIANYRPRHGYSSLHETFNLTQGVSIADPSWSTLSLNREQFLTQLASGVHTYIVSSAH